jgi:hypothetical protein
VVGGKKLIVRNGVASALALLAMTAAGAAFAQAADVPYVPTPPAVVDAMLKLAEVRADDYVMDLGSGDGRIVIAAAEKYGARGLGVELDPNLVSEARRLAERHGVSSKVKFEARNLFITDIAPATVLTMYLFTSVLSQLRPRIFSDLKAGTRVVSHEFDFGNWTPDAKMTIPVPDKRYGPPSSNVYLWIVPAHAAGTWRWELDLAGAFLECELMLEQRFQALRGTARLAGQPAKIESARLQGERIAVVLNGTAGGRDIRVELNGNVASEIITGHARVAGAPADTEWNAIRTSRGKINIE